MLTNDALILTSFRGGLNDTDPESDIADDQLTVALNIDLDRAPLGAKAYGSTHGSNGFDAPAGYTKCVFLSRHLPTNNIAEQRLVATAISGTTALWKNRTTSWATLTPIDALAVASGQYHIQSKSIHGKLFLAYPSEGMIDRLHVWQLSDTGVENTIRRAGIAEPGVPTVANVPYAAPAFVERVEVMGQASPVSAPSITIAAGNAIVVMAHWNSTATPTVSDDKGNSYALAHSQTITLWATQRMGIWVAPNCVAGATVVTITEGGGSFFHILDVWEVSGIKSTSPVDVVVSQESTVASPATSGNTAAMSQNAGFVIGFIVNATDDLTVGSTYTVRHDDFSTLYHLTESKVVSAGGVQAATATFGGTGDWAAMCVVLKAGGTGQVDPTKRYYRVRGARKLAGVIVRRSEPSDAVEFTPSGAERAIAITVPAASGELTNEGVNYFEIEASSNNADFYVINEETGAHGEWTTGSGAPGSVWEDRIPLVSGYGTAPFLSSTLTVGYSPFDLSPDLGDYTVIYAPKFLASDNDRLLYGGSWYDSTKGSRVGWTPVFGGPGVGNDERLEADTDPYLDLDGGDGGELTGMTDAINGILYAFKWGHIYRIIRTGNRAKAYDAKLITNKRGAIPGSIDIGVDERGQECVYFADPQYGPCRVGTFGVEDCAGDVQTLWQTVNLAADVICRASFYPKRKWVTFAFAASAATTPDTAMRLHVKRCQRTENGVRRGWVKLTTNEARMLTTCLYATGFTQTEQKLAPTWGRVNGVLSPTFFDTVRSDLIRQSWETANDNHNTAQGDNQVYVYTATATSKNFLMGGLLRQKGVVCGTIVVVPPSSVSVVLSRNYGAETETKVISTSVAVNHLDDLRLSELRALQVTLTNATVEWQVNALALKLVDQGPA